MSDLARASVPVTVVIAARDEARDIAGCIASVAWASEVLVVENDSADDTVERARMAGATVFSHPFVTIGGQRNAAIARARHEWVLVVDADERGTTALGVEVGYRIENATGPVAWRVARRNVFLGREIRHGGWERDRPVRLFHRTCRYDDRAVHERVVVEGEVEELEARLWHEPYATLEEYFDKLVRYARDWAAQHHARGKRVPMGSVVTRPAARFMSMYLLRSGWRDGAPGALLAVLAATSVAAKYAFLWELSWRERRVKS